MDGKVCFGTIYDAFRLTGRQRLMVLMRFAEPGTATVSPGDAVTLETPAGVCVETAVTDIGTGRFAQPDSLVLQLGSDIVENMTPVGTKIWVDAGRVGQS